MYSENKMIWAFLLMGLGVAAVIEGALSFNCDNVILSQDIIQCHGEGLGGIPGSLASLGLIVLGLFLFFGGILNVGSPRRYR